MELRDDVFAASSTAQTSRPLDFVDIKEEIHGTFIGDCVKAYYQAEQTEEVCVELMAEYLEILAALGRPRTSFRSSSRCCQDSALREQGG